MTANSDSNAAQPSGVLAKVLAEVVDGKLDIAAALERLRNFPVDNSLTTARIDTHRELRTGVAEVVLCEGKSTDQVVAILARLQEHHGRALGTRAAPEVASEVELRLPDVRYDPVSRLLTLGPPAAQGIAEKRSDGGAGQAVVAAGVDDIVDDAIGIETTTAVVSGGTADLPVAEEAAQTLEFLGCLVTRLYDVGVAGVHRLLSVRPQLAQAAVVISVAGMEGALTSVVAGLVPAPVIGVPTSVGYGANLGGVSALLTMLNTCASGVAVVNIDNGFGAAMMAHAFVSQIHRIAGK